MLLNSTGAGDTEFRFLIKKRLQQKKHINTTDNEVLIMTGGQQGLYLLPRVFVNEGDFILTEELSYAGMLDTVSDFGGRSIAVRTDPDGINLNALEHAFQAFPHVRYLYLVPNFNNPTGVTMPLEKRKAVYDLACRYDKLIVEDDPYGYLRYAGEDVPTIKSLDKENRVIYLGTFSKTVAAGLRVGFMLAPTPIFERAAANKASIDSNTPMLNQMICYHCLTDYNFDENIRRIIQIDGNKWRKTKESLLRHVPENWRISNAEGGLFYFIYMPEGLDESEVFHALLENRVGLVPSSAFSPDPRHPFGGFRLCFTPMTEEQIEEGAKRFGEVAAKFNEKLMK
ncbi:MAG: PLP-dependent aminotransferase family protein [Eubacteriales bacterium]|nr:PLP-dependent aminotransferase family protein [Eubacteriales bacterium]